MKRLVLIALALLLVSTLSACASPGFTRLTGKVSGIEYSDSSHQFLRFNLYTEMVKFDDGISHRGTLWVDVPVTDDAKSITIDEYVHVECYYDEMNIIANNACKLLDHHR